MTGRGRGESAGFTLLEVLVALAILSVAVVASIQGFAQGLRLLKLSGDHQQAVLIADEKAREIVVPEEGRQEGQEQRGATTFSWETTTTSVPAPDLARIGGDPAWRVFRIAVRVRWDERRHVEIATLRTAPVTAEGTVTATSTPTGSPQPPGAPTTTGSPRSPTRTLPGPAPPSGTTRFPQ